MSESAGAFSGFKINSIGMGANRLRRRDFIKRSAGVAGSLAFAGFPQIVPATIFGKNAPSNRIHVGAIGVGRISRIHDMPGVWKNPYAQLVAVCDVDSKRAREGAQLVNEYYSGKTGKRFSGVAVHDSFYAMVSDKNIDAVLISTPDHSHALIAVEAARAGKHIYLQKPASLTIAEGRILSNVVQKSGVVFQIGSQQRSSEQFRFAAELVRNGRIGALKKVYVGLPGDPGGNPEPEMPVPDNLDYDRWLGSTPEVYYTENRVHPQNSYERPGWLRCEQFGAGMITGWGSHHIDAAHWAMDTELTGPVEVWGHADFPASGLWDVHGIFKTEALYQNGVHMVVSNELPNGIRFEGSEGWLFVTRGNYRATASDPVNADGTKPLDASNPEILTAVIGPLEKHLMVSKDHHDNWLSAIRNGTPVIAPVEVAHRSCSTCLLHHIVMKLGRRVQWDPAKEKFVNDAEADKLLSRIQRAPYQIKA